MAVLEIALMGKPVLRQVAEPVSADELKSKEFQNFIDDFIETACQTPEPGYMTVGLAAPQVFESKRFFVAALPGATAKNPKFEVYINPEIEYISNEVQIGIESCLSTPGLCGEVTRHKEVEITYTDRKGKKQKEKISGERATFVQHEFDHIEGVLWIDKVTDTKTISFC